MLNKLRRKLTVLSACLTGSVVIVVCLVSFLLIRGQYLHSRDLAFQMAAATVYTQWQTEDSLSADWLSASADTNQYNIALWENHIPISYGISDFAKADRLLQMLPAGQPEDNTLYFTSGDYCCAWIGFPFSYGSRQFLMWQDTTAENGYLLQLGVVFLVIVAISLSVVSLLCYLVAGRAILPARDAMERQERFVASASHELRSPLTVLRTGFDVMEKDPAQTEHCLPLMRGETIRMSKLVDDLLFLAGGGSLRKTFSPDPIEPDTLMIEFADGMMPVARKTDVRLEVSLPENAAPRIKADEHMLRQLLTILVDNALRYAPKGSAITLDLRYHGQWCLLSVADHGPGIADSEKLRIFDRFYRGSRSRTDPKHFGLGLSVAKELVAIHGGKIWAEDTPGGGATFVVKLPL